MANTRTQIRIWKDRIQRRLFGIATDVRTTWADTPKKMDTTEDFLDWFDATDSIKSTLKRADADWKFRFKEFPYFANVNKGSALEIGFGAGRLLLEASRTFKEVYGVDIHKAFDRVETFLKERGVNNFHLVHRNALSAVPNASLDFVYSFIVIQHFDAAEELWHYLNECLRLLKPGAYAHLYFGKNTSQGVKVTSSKSFTLRDASLFIHPDVMHSKAANIGFEIVEMRDRLPKNAADGTGESMQACVVLRKPLST